MGEIPTASTINMSMLTPIVQGKRVLVIGPASAIRNHSQHVDFKNYDVYVRFNYHWIDTVTHPQYCGTETTVVFCNGRQWTRETLHYFNTKVKLVMLRAAVGQILKLDKLATPHEYINPRICEAFSKLYGTEIYTGVLAVKLLVNCHPKQIDIIGFDFQHTDYLTPTSASYFRRRGVIPHNREINEHHTAGWLTKYPNVRMIGYDCQ